MPPIEETDLLDTALLWRAIGYDSHGQRTFGDPAEIRCRWLTNKHVVLDPKGSNIISDGVVVVDEDIDIGSLMWLGTLEDWNGMFGAVGSSAVPSDLMQVKSFKSTPDVRARVARREVGVMRYRDLPETS